MIFLCLSGKREIYLHNSEKSCTFAGKIDMKGNKTMVATNLSQTATQMIVNIANGKGVRVSSKQELDAQISREYLFSEINP